jgi:hypothetical protein
MHKKMRRLALGKETLSALAEERLNAALGADPTQSPRSQVDACPTRLCPTNAGC